MNMWISQELTPTVQKTAPSTAMYNQVKNIIDDKFPIAYHECGIPPDPNQRTATVTYTYVCGETSERTFIITVKPATGIASSDRLKDLKVCPIPSNDFIFICLPDPSYPPGTSVNLFNANGALIYKTTLNTNLAFIDVSYLKPGSYMLNIVSDKAVVNKSIIKQNTVLH